MRDPRRKCHHDANASLRRRRMTRKARDKKPTVGSSKDTSDDDSNQTAVGGFLPEKTICTVHECLALVWRDTTTRALMSSSSDAHTDRKRTTIHCIHLGIMSIDLIITSQILQGKVERNCLHESAHILLMYLRRLGDYY